MSTGGALAPFRQPVFRAIWLATLISNFGAVLQSTGAAWMMTTLTGSPRMVALVQSSATLPIMLFAMVSGAVADAYDRRRVMLVAQWVMLAASALLALLTFLHRIEPAMLLLCTLAVGCGTALHTPAWQASIRAQVPIEDLPAAIALNSVNYNLARSLGPAIGGALMVVAGAAANFTVNACSYIGLIAVLLRWQPSFDHAPRRAPLGAAVRIGIATAYATPAVRAALIRGAIFGLSAAALWALMPIIARDLLGGGQGQFGLILGAFGAGSIVGALLAARVRRRWGSELVFSGSSLLFAAGVVDIALSHRLGTALLGSALAGAAWVMLLSTINVTVQMAAPPDVVGRCLSLYHMHAFGGLAIGSFIWGSIAEHYGVARALLGSVIVLAVSPLLVLLLPLPGRVVLPTEETIT